jgi:antitoxin component YwqK of YwqJK toxin-antitoxin module
MKNIVLFGILLIFVCYSCDESNRIPKHGAYTHQIKNDDGTYVIEEYLDGKLQSLHNAKDNKYHGEAFIYYKSGKLHKKLVYENGKLEGDAIWYYENGKAFEVAPHVGNKIHGIKKSWHENGNVRSVQEYANGKPLPGLKEWSEDGTPKKMPELQLRRIDRMIYENKYIIECSLSEKSKSIKYYKIINKGSSNEDKLRLTESRGVAHYEVYLREGEFHMEDLCIRAESKTLLGNNLVLEQTIRLALHNN